MIFSLSNISGQLTVAYLTAIILTDIRADETCLTWVSVEDGLYRDHCYWYQTSDDYLRAFEAEYICSTKGGNLAPYIDSFQYNELKTLRGSASSQTFIGMTDLFEEGKWTQFDGSPVVSPLPFDSQYGQPDDSNKTQNRVVISQHPSSSPDGDKMQDKPCAMESTDHNKPSSMLCYRNVNNYCLHWNSTDGYRRYQCYSFITSEHYWSYFDVIKNCSAQGGSIAPVIDDEQLSFLLNTFNTIQLRIQILTTGFTFGGVWLGANTFRRQKVDNWNGSPYLRESKTLTLGQEKCSSILNAISSPSLQFISCSDRSTIKAAFCIRSREEYWPRSSNDSCRIDDTTTTASVKINTTHTTVDHIKSSLAIDKRKTNAHIQKLTSAPDDRASAKSIGVLGAVVLLSVSLVIVFLDCINIWKVKEAKFITTKN